MEEKKYELLEADSIEYKGEILYRIRALKDFGTVKAGDLGGYVASENNLSHDRNAWISDDAKSYGSGWVSGDATVGGRAEISENAVVSGASCINGNAVISGNAWVSGTVWIDGHGILSGKARVS